MSTKRTAADDAEASAQEVLAQRRELNRLAQKRHRDRAREAKKAAAEEALKRQQETPLAASSSRIGASSAADGGGTGSSSSAATEPSFESLAWLSGTLEPVTRNAWLDTESHVGGAAATYGPSAPEQHQRVMLTAPHGTGSRQAVMLGRGPDASNWGLRDATTSASTPWNAQRPPPLPPLPPQLQPERIYAAPQAVPVPHGAWYGESSSRSSSNSSGIFSIAPSASSSINSSAFITAPPLPPEASPMPTSWYHDLYERNLQPVDSSVTAVQQQQLQLLQRQEKLPAAPARVTGKAPLRSVESSLSAAMPAGDAAASAKVGQARATDTSSGEVSNFNSPETVETIGSHIEKRNAPKGPKGYEYADILQAAKAWRLYNSPNMKGINQPTEPLPEDGSVDVMTDAAQQIYDSMVRRVLQYREMTPQEFNEWMQPRVVRTEDFAMLQTLDFAKALSRIAIIAKQQEIDDVSILSDIAASWSLSETSRNDKAASDGDLSPHTSLDREWHTQRWRDIPKNLWPTDSQLKITHRPWLDFGVVWPEVRDRILRLLQAGAIDEDELCADLFICGTYVPGEPPFRIWGTNACDPMAWEVGEAFAQKWHFLFNEDIIHRSNWWRKQRKLEPIRIDTTSILP